MLSDSHTQQGALQVERRSRLAATPLHVSLILALLRSHVSFPRPWISLSSLVVISISTFCRCFGSFINGLHSGDNAPVVFDGVRVGAHSFGCFPGTVSRPPLARVVRPVVVIFFPTSSIPPLWVSIIAEKVNLRLVTFPRFSASLPDNSLLRKKSCLCTMSFAGFIPPARDCRHEAPYFIQSLGTTVRSF